MEEAVKNKPCVNGIATAALILGIVAALGFVFVLPPFICGATAITLGLLSRSGGELSLRAKIGICMGVLSIVLLCVVLISAVHLILTNPEILEIYNDTVNEMYRELLEQKGGFV